MLTAIGHSVLGPLIVCQVWVTDGLTHPGFALALGMDLVVQHNDSRTARAPADPPVGHRSLFRPRGGAGHLWQTAGTSPSLANKA